MNTIHPQSANITTLKRSFALAIALTSVAHSGYAQPVDPDELQSQQIARINARLDELEAPPRGSASVQIGRRGLEVGSSDGNYTLRIRPRVQTDFLWFTNDDGSASGLTLRRARPVFQGDAGPLSWRFMPEFAGDTRILDAWADVRLANNAVLRVGKAKGPIGLERLQSFSHTLFNERGLPSNLTPTREIGVQYLASALDGRFDWSVGVYNGSLDDSDQSNNANFSDDFDYGARAFLHPFKNNSESVLKGLGFGFGISAGQEQLTIADSDRDKRLRYRSSGRHTIFRYNDGVELDGARLRLNPGLYYYHGRFGLLSEYVLSRYDIRRDDVSREISADGFTVQTSWVLTGENASYGYVHPNHPYSWPGNANGNGKGAFEIGLRYHQLEVDDDAFDGAASTRLARDGSVQKASAYGFALKWYLTDNLLATLNYEITNFSGDGATREPEKVLHSRLQLDF